MRISYWSSDVCSSDLPGTGKTVLAHEVAKALSTPLLEWHIKSTTKAQHGLYEYDAVKRLRDSQLGDEKVHDIRNYTVRGKLWEAFTSEERPILLKNGRAWCREGVGQYV